jgi:hypothetical protein
VLPNFCKTIFFGGKTFKKGYTGQAGWQIVKVKTKEIISTQAGYGTGTWYPGKSKLSGFSLPGVL